MRYSLIGVVLVFGSSLLVPYFAEAQSPTRTYRGGQVVHARLAPVVMHRVLPPYRGKHVYQGRVR